MTVKSKALEVNLADYHVDVIIDAKYCLLQEVMSKYYGLMEGLNIFLEELSHPYKNWRFIVAEARKYSLEYFHLLKSHPRGPEAANLLIEIFFDAAESCKDAEVKGDSVDNILLFIQKAIRESGTHFTEFQGVIDDTFTHIRSSSDDLFFLFVRSYYAINRLAETYLKSSPESCTNFKSLNLLLIKYYQHTYGYWLDKADPQTWFEKEAVEIDQNFHFDKFFQSISHRRLKDCRSQLELNIRDKSIESEEVLIHLLELPGFGQIVDAYRQIPRQ